MPKNIFAILVLCLSATGYGQGTAVPRNIAGYGKTTWGMTPDQVVSAEKPRAEMLERPVRYYTGLGLVTIKEIDIEAAKFSVMFIFEGARQELGQVNLSSAEQTNGGINARSFSNLEKLLTEKYGPPTFKDEGRTVSWSLARTSIELENKNFPGILSSVTVVYRPISDGRKGRARP
jgi:hypothetical protein